MNVEQLKTAKQIAYDRFENNQRFGCQPLNSRFYLPFDGLTKFNAPRIDVNARTDHSCSSFILLLLILNHDQLSLANICVEQSMNFLILRPNHKWLDQSLYTNWLS